MSLAAAPSKYNAPWLAQLSWASAGTAHLADHASVGKLAGAHKAAYEFGLRDRGLTVRENSPDGKISSLSTLNMQLRRWPVHSLFCGPARLTVKRVHRRQGLSLFPGLLMHRRIDFNILAGIAGRLRRERDQALAAVAELRCILP